MSAGLGLDCRYCHTSVEKARFAGIPPTETCMTCHSQIWTNAADAGAGARQASPRTGRSAGSASTTCPDYVYFDHSVHVAKGVGCTTCHGASRPDEADAAGRPADHGLVPRLPPRPGPKPSPPRGRVRHGLDAPARTREAAGRAAGRGLSHQSTEHLTRLLHMPPLSVPVADRRGPGLLSGGRCGCSRPDHAGLAAAASPTEDRALRASRRSGSCPACRYASPLPCRSAATGAGRPRHRGRRAADQDRGQPAHPASLGAHRRLRRGRDAVLYDPDRSRTVTERVNGIASWECVRRALAVPLAQARAGQGRGLPPAHRARHVADARCARSTSLLQAIPEAVWHVYEPSERRRPRCAARRSPSAVPCGRCRISAGRDDSLPRRRSARARPGPDPAHAVASWTAAATRRGFGRIYVARGRADA